MTKKSKPLTFYYKKIKLDDSITFEDILLALQHLSPEERQLVEGKKTYILNHISASEGIYYGEIICYETDKVQSIIHDTEKDNNLIERAITTKDVKSDDEDFKSSNSEFVNSRIIFGISENHLAICPSVLGVDRFVTYFNFLLNSYYWKDPQNAKTLLVTDVYQKSLQEKLKKTHVRRVKIGQGVLTHHSDKLNDQPFKLKDKSLLAKISSTVGKKLGFKSTMDDSNLRVNVTIDYKRNTSTEGQNVLDDLTTSLATLDDSFIEIEFEDGSDYKRGNIRVKSTINQHILNNNNFDRIKLVKDIRAFLYQSID